MTPLRCSLGIHRRLPFSTGNRFDYSTYRCARCGGTWYLVVVGRGFDASPGWVRLT